MRKRGILCLLLGIAFAVQSFQMFADVPVPVDLKLGRATYTKITIQWLPGDENTQIDSYKVLRDDAEIATTTVPQYSDSGLQTGTQYVYKVIAVSGGVSSLESSSLTIKTIKSVAFEGSGDVEQMVDNMHSVDPGSSTSVTLIAAVKTGLETLLNLSFSYEQLDADTLSNFVDQELATINEVAPEMTEAERQAAQEELNTFLAENYGGNSFEHVYIQSKLSELAESHWLIYVNDPTATTRKFAAEALYNFSLNYLKDQEHIVFGTLSRLAAFKVFELNDESTSQQIAAALNDYRATSLRFFDYFPESISSHAQNTYSTVAAKYFSYFPRL
ncbi:MAG: fibronectin type III domain-containing protein, partial [Victivallaceae bacterium]